jgi:membrane-associated HD superfamily phosphohydrolase
MLCDHLEARSRSLVQAGKIDEINNLVEVAFRDLNDDEQFDEVTIKLAHLRKVKFLLRREITSQYHKRIEYDINTIPPNSIDMVPFDIDN